MYRESTATRSNGTTIAARPKPVNPLKAPAEKVATIVQRVVAPGMVSPSLCVLGEEGGENPRDLRRGILHHEVAGPRYQLELRTWDLLLQPRSLRGIEPPVLRAPHHENGDLDGAEQGLDIPRVSLLELKGLPDEGLPTFLPPPRREVSLDSLFAKVAVGFPQVGREERPEQVLGHGLVGSRVLTDV